MADNTARIAEIREILAQGVDSITTDGNSVHFDLDQLRSELRLLMAEDDTQAGRRPVVVGFNLSSAF